MKRSFTNLGLYVSLGFALTCVSRVLPAQEEDPRPQGTATGVTNASSETPADSEKPKNLELPEPLGGLVPRLGTDLENQEHASLLFGGIGLNALYTDNAFTSGSAALSDFQVSILPTFGWQGYAKHTQWNLDYAGGLTVDQRVPGNTQQTQGAVADVRHDFTRRLTSELREDFAITSSPFTQIGESSLLPTVTGPGQLSAFAIPFLATRKASVSTANLAYQLGPDSATGVSGSYSLQDFSNFESPEGTNATLIDTASTVARAFYLHQVFWRQTVGTEYQLQDLRYAGDSARSLDQTVFLFDGIALRHNMTLVIYGGPEHTYTHNAVLLTPAFLIEVVPVLAHQWSYAEGVAYRWQGRKTWLRVSQERSVGDGGGWLGTVRLNTANFELNRALGPHWSATLDLLYSDGSSVTVPSNLPGNRITTEEAVVGLQYRLSKNVLATAEYGRIQEPHIGLLTPALRPNHDELQVGFTYQFQKVLSH